MGLMGLESARLGKAAIGGVRSEGEDCIEDVDVGVFNERSQRGV